MRAFARASRVFRTSAAPLQLKPLPQCCQRDVKQNIYSCLISRLPKIIVKKKSETPGEEVEELGEEDGQEDTENSNND